MGVNITPMPPVGPFFETATSGRRGAQMRSSREHDGFLTKVTEVAPRVGTLGLARLSIIGLSGCHTSWLLDRPAALLDSVRCLTAWKVYLHCRSSVELEDIRADLQHLNRLAKSLVPGDHASVFLFPDPIRALIAAVPCILAVDLKTMSAAGSLDGSHMAQAADQHELSVEWLTEHAAHEGWAASRDAIQAGHQLRRLKEMACIGEERWDRKEAQSVTTQIVWREGRQRDGKQQMRLIVRSLICARASFNPDTFPGWSKRWVHEAGAMPIDRSERG